LIEKKHGGKIMGEAHLVGRVGSGPLWSLLRLSPQKQEGYVDLLHQYLPEVEAYYPVYTKKVRPHGVRRAREVTRPVYPGYLFILVGGRDGNQCGDVDMRGPVSLPVSARWVRFGGHVEAVPDFVIRKLRDMEKAGELVREVRYVDPYIPGTQVRVHTPVQDILAVIVRLVGRNRVLVDTPMCRITVPIHRLQIM
jgi:hypothetical protein